ncbi:MAG: MCP four helix bundle domain-containing protein, partial [Candidatus Omnitrophica bacterium]|nr:MCP four helix bundle domain-containing protein [Candidatus Omnitrophota bacterium]
MRISRKIGLSFFITFLLVILLGGVSIYSLRHIYTGLSQVFKKDLPAARSTYQIAVSMENALLELNTYLITGNENFKVSYERSFKDMQDDISGLKRFIFKEEEITLFEDLIDLAGDIDRLSGDIFEKRDKIKTLFKSLKVIEGKYSQRLDDLFDFEESKMSQEKDLLLVQAQYIPASQLIMEARSKFSDLLNDLVEYVMRYEKDDPLSFMDNLLVLDKSLRDYKNYYGYSLSDKERFLTTELIDSSGEIKSIVKSIVDLKGEILRDMDFFLAKEKDFMGTVEKMIALKKSGISSKLGIGATLTE